MHNLPCTKVLCSILQDRVYHSTFLVVYNKSLVLDLPLATHRSDTNRCSLEHRNNETETKDCLILIEELFLTVKYEVLLYIVITSVCI